MLRETRASLRPLGWVASVLILVCIGARASAEVGDYSGHKVIRVYASNWDELARVRGMARHLYSEAEGLGKRGTDYILPPEAMADLDALGVRYDVLIDDLQPMIDAERKRIERAAPVDARDDAWFEEYKTFAQIVDKLETMAADRPDLVTVFEIGSTVNGNTIWALRITGPEGSDKPGVLFNGTQHAREWISPMVNMYLAEKLVYDYETDPEVRWLVDHVDFFIVPVVNPDGYLHTWEPGGRMWRKNRRAILGSSCLGIDLNRNWGGTGWGGGGSSGDPCDDLYRGPTAFSELETQALRDLFTANPQIVSTIDYHSYSQLILSPWGYTSELPEDHETFMDIGLTMQATIQAVHGEYYEAGPIYSTIYPASGGSVDWCYEDQGLFAFTIELRPDSPFPGFELPAEEIIPTCEENYPAAMYLARWSATPVLIDFPDGQPTRLEPGTPQPLVVQVTEIRAELEPDSLRLHTRLGVGPFQAHPLTSLGDDRYEAMLPGVGCGRTLEYYISAETTDGDLIVAPGDGPASPYEVTASPLTILLDEPMDADPGWQTEADWAWGQPTGGGGEYGGPDPTSGFTGNNVYGYNLYGDYDNLMPERHLTTGAIDCSNATGVTLSFQRWLGVEQAQYDHAYVRVSNNGTTWHTVWENTSTLYDGAWVAQEFDISAYADNEPAVYLRWTMGTTDTAWRFCGWNIDDVEVWAIDPAGCPFVPGDGNGDGVIDLADMVLFTACLGGPDGSIPGECEATPGAFDFDEDGDVDMLDFAGFQEAYEG